MRQVPTSIRALLVLGVILAQAGTKAPPQAAPDASAAAGDGTPRAVDTARWACLLRAGVSRQVLSRCRLEFRQECVAAALEKYDADVEGLARSDDAKTTASKEALEREYREFLAGSPEQDSTLDESERARLVRAKERLAEGEPAFNAADPFCAKAMNRRYQESRQALYIGEMTARRALTDGLAECATPRMAETDVDRLRSRLTVEASNRGVEDRRFHGGIDPGLLVSFDLYGELEKSMSSRGALAAMSESIFAIRQLDAGAALKLDVAAQRAILSFDADAGSSIDAWIRTLTTRAPANDLTRASAEQELKACDQIIGNLIRRRWLLVGEIAAVLKESGAEEAGNAWLVEAGMAMFPSAYEAGRSDKFMEGAQASGTLSIATLQALRQRFHAFEQLRSAARARLITALTSGAGVSGRRSPASTEQIEGIRSELSGLDASCASELASLSEH